MRFEARRSEFGFESGRGQSSCFAAGCARVGWDSELRADPGRTVRIVKIVSLSPRVDNLKVNNVIKVSYLNQESRQCFAGFLSIEYISHIRRLWLCYTVNDAVIVHEILF